MVGHARTRPKPEIIAFITSYFPALGGAEVALRQVAERLSSEFEFLIVTARGRAGLVRLEAAEEGAVWRLGVGHAIDKWLLPATAQTVRRRVARLRADGTRVALWGMDITQASLAASLLRGRDAGLPFVLTVQYGGGPGRLAHGRGGLIGRSLRFMLRRADRVTAISTHLAELVRAHGYGGEVSLIPNGVDLSRFCGTRPDSPPRRPTVITVSRLVEKNGVDTLLRAMPSLMNSFPDVACTIIGDGPERQALMRLSHELGLAACVRFYGEVQHEDIPGLLGEGDVFVRASRSEGMGTAFIEALACGLPIIGAPVGGTLDVIRDGETGLLCGVDDPAQLADKVRLLLEDRRLAARLAEGGMTMVRERYDAEAVARSYSEVFHGLLGR